MGKVISFVSGKGGVGKTVITANVGLALSKLNKKVLVVDMDLGLRDLDIVLGVENRILYDITDVLNGTVDYERAVVKASDYNDITLLPASQTRKNEEVSKDSLCELLKKLRLEFDYILLDSPSGIGVGFENCVSVSDCVVVVITPDVCSFRNADKVLSELDRLLADNAKLLINRQGAKFLKSGKKDAKKQIDSLSVECLGIISEGKLEKSAAEIAKRIVE